LPKRRVAVVGGCGHVGLPLSIAFAPHHSVLIYDTDRKAVERVRRGEMPFIDEGADDALKAALAAGMTVTDSPAGIADCDIVVIVIGTPVDEHLNPSFTVFDRVLKQLSEVLHDGQTVVLRSTVYPGTPERVQEYFRRRGMDVEVVFCPERVAQGQALREIRELPQIISGFSERGLAVARELFGALGVELIELAPLEAELTKLFNNVYRYISFAVANQFYMVACEYGLDFHKVLHALRYNYPRGAHIPGPGFAAGPCLFKDTMQMSAFNNNTFFLGHAAMLVNEGLPDFVVKRMLRHWPNLDEMTVGLLGMAFKADSDDARESLSYKLRKILQISAREVLATDPLVPDATLLPQSEVMEKADVFVIGAPHSCYRDLDFGGRPVVDIWNILGKGTAI